jgi:hypothetical protein
MAVPNWYPDPAGGGRLRYWDGRTWTSHLWPPIAVADLESSARRAKTAVLIAVPAQAVSAALSVSQFGGLRRAIDDMDTQIQQGTTTTGSTQVHLSPVGSVLSTPISLGLIVVWVLFLVWFHKAAVAARQLGRPARQTPGMAVAGWFIPFANFVLPARSATDFFRPGDPRRGSVAPWWAAWLVATIATPLLMVGIGLTGHDSGLDVLAVAVLAFVLWLAAAVAAIRFLDDATTSIVDDAALG